MPNQVTTRCTVTGPIEQIAAFRDMMFVQTDDEMAFDFERLVPMPKIVGDVPESTASETGMRLIILRGERGAPFETMGLMPHFVERIRGDLGMPDDPIYRVAAAFLEKHPNYETEGRLRLRSILATGYGGWYSWCLAHWGTKWNSYSFDLINDDPLIFRFDTAWSFPIPVFEKLAQEYPTLRFNCLTFDEGWNFAGQGCFNPLVGESPFELCEATKELYEQVYGEPYVEEEE